MNIRVFKEKNLVIASHNDGKVQEIKKLLEPLEIKVLSAKSFNIIEPEENGSSFEENALIKSIFVAKKTGLPALSDDSGICFKDLDDKPGIFSARWAPGGDFKLGMFKINEEINKIKQPSKQCKFVWALSLCWPDQFNITVSGTIEGIFSWPPKAFHQS